MNYKQFANYTAIDFSTDPRFLEWRWFQSVETSQFWNGFLSEYPEKNEEILLAIKIVESIREENDIFFSEQEKGDAIRKLTVKVHRYKQRQRRAIYSIGTLVVMVLLFFLPLTHTKQIGGIHQIEDSPMILKEHKDVQLILSSGGRSSFNEDIQIKYDSIGNIVVESESGKMLENHVNKTATASLNHLIVPKGKRSSLVLADGSRIWVNSGSSVQFPSYFSKNEERRITVVGEIYIEVEKDPQRPFLVTTKNFEVAVLGTAFNVSAYSEDALQHVTVAEGSVSIVSGEEETRTVITKNQQLRMFKGHDAEVNHVEVYNYISWREGILRFESEPLQNILTRLSRYYDIDLVYDEDIQSVHCTGKLYLFDDWQVVLDNITIVSPIEYAIMNNQVTFSHSKK